jgi:HrpA-like RNA helicase
MSNGLDVGKNILQFAQAFTAMKQREQELEFRRQQAIVNENLAAERLELQNKSLAVREDLLNLRAQDGELKNQIAEQNLELKQIQAAKQKHSLETTGRRESVRAMDSAIKTMFTEARLLAGREEGTDILALLSGQPKATKSEDQGRLDSLLTQIRSLSEERNRISGITFKDDSVLAPDIAQIKLPESNAPIVNVTGTPTAPADVNPTVTPGKTAIEPRGDQEDALIRQQGELFMEIGNASAQIRQFQRQRNDPKFTGDRVQLLREERALRARRDALKIELRNTASGGIP